MNELILNLENIINYQFKDTSYLQKALTHRSIGKGNNERLEYLGDAALGFIIADIIYNEFPRASEGELTRLRASLVKGETLASLGNGINLGEYIKLGAGERKSGGWRRDSIIANTLEALIGAIYLDGGIKECQRFIHSIYEKLLSEVSPDKLSKDPKTALQELLQSRAMTLPVYNVISESGKAHERYYTVECVLDEQNIAVQAEGRSKRIAEQASAEKALSLLNDNL